MDIKDINMVVGDSLDKNCIMSQFQFTFIMIQIFHDFLHMLGFHDTCLLLYPNKKQQVCCMGRRIIGIAAPMVSIFYIVTNIFLSLVAMSFNLGDFNMRRPHLMLKMSYFRSVTSIPTQLAST